MPRRTPSRDRLIEAAAALFYEQGIHRTSVDAIVESAGVTKPTFYNQFRSKDELVTAVMDRRSEAWHQSLARVVDGAASPEAGLQAAFGFLDDFIRDPEFRGCALVNAAVEIPDAADPSRAVARDNKRRNRERFEGLAREAGLQHPERLARALSLLFEGAIVAAYVEGDPGAASAARGAAEQLIAAARGDRPDP